MQKIIDSVARVSFIRTAITKLRNSATMRQVLISTILSLAVLFGIAFMTLRASNVNVLKNGDFEDGFYQADGCGIVGNYWHCLTNGGGANYGFYDEQWDPVVANGEHGQLIEVNTKGIGAADADRYAGLYQTVAVVDWAEYTLSLKGMIRTTILDGDPWRYRVQVGWTQGAHADWTKVTNWTDVGWDTYYERTAPGSMSDYSTKLRAEDDYMTIYVRIWKKWGIPNEEIDLNLDSIALVGPTVGGYYAPTAPQPTAQPTVTPVTNNKPVAPTTEITCQGSEYVYNGGFEHGFNLVSVGYVGKSWGAFTNGGAAGYGFYDEMWPLVISDGSHGQLIEINHKDLYPGDPDRYAGIYQKITGLQPGATYELTLRGMVRGTFSDDDPDRFVAQWGYNSGYDTSWEKVGNWTSMDLGAVYSRTEPGPMGSYSVRFKAPAQSMVLFLRGWKKWAFTNDEMDLNFDSVSLRGCTTKTHYPKQPSYPAPSSCIYVVQPGDSLGYIAQQKWVTVYDLMRVNGIQNADIIYVGQQLLIPGCSAAGAPTYQQPTYAPEPQKRWHTVRPGDTISQICATYGVDPNTLISVNGIANPNFIYVGQELLIP